MKGYAVLCGNVKKPEETLGVSPKQLVSHQITRFTTTTSDHTPLWEGERQLLQLVSDNGKEKTLTAQGSSNQGSSLNHWQRQMGTDKVRSYITVLRSGLKGLYVSTRGFTKEARYEAERAEVPLTLIDLDGLVWLVMQYHDNFDA